MTETSPSGVVVDVLRPGRGESLETAAFARARCLSAIFFDRPACITWRSTDSRSCQHPAQESTEIGAVPSTVITCSSMSSLVLSQ